MATTLAQYWTDEVTRLSARLVTQRAEVAAQRATLLAAQAVKLSASDALRTQAAAVDAARKALAGIPMPADGDPLLAAMELALVALADAQAALASADFVAQAASAELKRQQAQESDLDAELAAAKATLVRETLALAARQAMIDKLTTGSLATLVADATTVLAASETTARARVEGEFPSSATNAKNFLKRVRARRGIVEDSLKTAGVVEAAAYAADTSALAQAQRAFGAAADAVRVAAESAPQLDADKATLVRLAALPAATATTFPIVTRWQHGRLHDASKKTARETALAKLTDVDAALIATRTAQQAYDTALHVAMKVEPDKTQAQLDATTLTTERGTLTTKLADLTTARGAMTVDELAAVSTWFAAVPEKLWEELDKLDIALARLTALVGPPTPADLITALTAAQTALTAALTADRLATRQQAAADAAHARAAGAQAAERETAPMRAKAYAHSAALF